MFLIHTCIRKVIVLVFAWLLGDRDHQHNVVGLEDNNRQWAVLGDLHQPGNPRTAAWASPIFLREEDGLGDDFFGRDIIAKTRSVSEELQSSSLDGTVSLALIYTASFLMRSMKPPDAEDITEAVAVISV